MLGACNEATVIMLCCNMQRKAIQVENINSKILHTVNPVCCTSHLLDHPSPDPSCAGAEDTVNMLCFNMQRKAIQVESGAKDTAVQARTRQGLRDMGIHHPINTQGHPVSFARDFVMLTGTTAQEPIRCAGYHMSEIPCD